MSLAFGKASAAAGVNLNTMGGKARFAVTALGIKDPGFELLLQRVPTDSLGAREYGLALGLHGELTNEEVTALGPRTGGGDDRVLALVDPVAHEPFQFFETVVRSKVVRGLVAHSGL